MWHLPKEPHCNLWQLYHTVICHICVGNTIASARHAVESGWGPTHCCWTPGPASLCPCDWHSWAAVTCLSNCLKIRHCKRSTDRGNCTDARCVWTGKNAALSPSWLLALLLTMGGDTPEGKQMADETLPLDERLPGYVHKHLEVMVRRIRRISVHWCHAAKSLVLLWRRDVTIRRRRLSSLDLHRYHCLRLTVNDVKNILLKKFPVIITRNKGYIEISDLLLNVNSYNSWCIYRICL